MNEWVTASAPYLAPRTAGEPDPWAQEAARAGLTGRHHLTVVERRSVPDVVAVRLGIDSGAAAVLRRRVVTLDERPVEVSDSWYPLAVADGTALAEAKPIRGGASRLLADLGYLPVRHTEDVGVCDPPAEIAALLGPESVLELIRTSYTETDMPFEVAVMLMTREMAPGQPRRLRYELRSV